MIRFLMLSSALSLTATIATADVSSVFPTPQDALDALIGALASGSGEQMEAVLGPDSEDLVRSDDSGERAEDWDQLLAAYEEGYRFVPHGPDSVELEFGDDDWPFPFPLKRAEAGWSFDLDAGRDEVVARRIGENELDVIDALGTYVELQREYRQVDHDGDGVLEFALDLISTDGTHDGLYWPGGDSPIGDLAARASLDGFDEDDAFKEPQPFLGYYFRVLHSQGPTSPGGEMDYVVNGHLLAGHALLAVPAEYGITGVSTFMVAENGVVLEADFGDDTLEIASEIFSYSPDENWSIEN